MGFLLFSKYFKFLALVFLDFVYMLRYENMIIEYGFVDVLLNFFYGFCWIILHVLHVCASFFFLHCIMYGVVLCISCS